MTQAFARLWCVVLLALALTASPCRAGAAAHYQSPFSWWNEAATNYRNSVFYATDLTTHASIGDALKRSMAPIDMGANVASAIKQQYTPLNLAWNVAFPIVTAVQRQMAASGHLDVHELLHTLQPKVLAGSIVGSLVGGAGGAVAGAALQSALAGMGPAGAAAGFILNPLINFYATNLGTDVGQHIGEGMSLRYAFGESFRGIQPVRDTGQALGVGLGYVAGQVLIPVPIIGGLIGSMIGGMVGAAVGDQLLKLPFMKAANSWMSGELNTFADWIEGKHGAAATTTAAADPPKAVETVVLGSNATAPKRTGDDPNTDDLPVTVH